MQLRAAQVLVREGVSFTETCIAVIAWLDMQCIQTVADLSLKASCITSRYQNQVRRQIRCVQTNSAKK